VFLWEFCSRLDFFLFTKDSPRKWADEIILQLKIDKASCESRFFP
jgi:hypothetical protein